MDFRILGPLEVARDGKPVGLGGAKQRAALAVLLLRANQTVSLDRLIDELWGAQPPPGAVQSVRVRVSRLRKVLEVDGDADAPSILVTTAGGYELRVEHGSLDLDRFEGLLADGRRALADDRPQRAAEVLREALSLWRGPALADLVNEPFVQTEAARLDELRVEAVEERIGADLALGHHAEVVAELDPLVAEHPLRERLRWLQMLALYRCGRQAEALEAYRDARRTLVEEIGTEPGAELRALHEAILRQDPAIAAPATAREPAKPAGRPPGPPDPHPAPTPAGRRPLRRPAYAVAAIVLGLGLAMLAIVLVAGGEESTAIAENSVGLVDPGDGSVTAQLPVGRGPTAAVADPETVWVANSLDGTVSRIDVETRQVTPLDFGGAPVGLGLGAGSLWVTSADDRDVVQINPETNSSEREIEVGNGPSGVAVGFGAVWVAASVDGVVARFDLSKARVTKRIAVGANPTAIVAGSGSVWVANETAGTVVRIDPRSGDLDPINVGNGPAGLAFGEGALWVANRDDGTVSRIDPETEAVTQTVPVGRSPTAVTTGEDAVWVANTGAGTISRIDPASAEVTETIDVGASPSALAIADGTVWATVLAAPESHRGGTLRLRWPTPDPTDCVCADPIAYDYVQGWQLTSLAYDGLIAYRREPGAASATLVGNLAADVPQPSPDGKTYVFELRPGIRYSNGAPVRPEDFRSSLERLLRANEQPLPPYFDRIPGARACGVEPRTCDLSKGIETDGAAGTITVHLTAPDPEFLHKLTLSVASVVPADSPRHYARGQPLPGTGPYRIESFDPERGGRLVRNPYFEVWSQDARPDGFPDEIAIDVGDDINAQVAAVERGDADVVTVAGPFGGPLSPAGVRELAIRHAARLYSAPLPETDFMFLNVSLPPFDDPRVRRALNYAIDRRRIVALEGGNLLAHPTCQIVPAGFPGFRPYCPYTLDPNPAGTWVAPDVALAQRLVDASQAKGTRVTVWVWPAHEPIARYFASLLRQLGFPSSVRVLPVGPYYDLFDESETEMQIGFNGWYVDYLAPSNFSQPLFSCPPQSNASRFCDRSIDAEADRALAQQGSGSATANALWAGVDRRLTDAAPAVTLFNRESTVFVSERVERLEQAAEVGVLADQVWVR